MRIGIIGNGFVGGSLCYGFQEFAELKIYDTDKQRSTHTMEEVVQTSDYILKGKPIIRLSRSSHQSLREQDRNLS